MQPNNTQQLPQDGATTPVKLSGTVKEVGYITELTLRGGTFYKFMIRFVDGREGEYLSKSKEQSVFVVGQQIEYEFSILTFGNKSYPKVKPVRKEGSQPAYKYKLEVAKQKCIIRQACHKTAVEVLGLFPRDQLNRLIEKEQLSSKFFEISKMLENDVLDGIEF